MGAKIARDKGGGGRNKREEGGGWGYSSIPSVSSSEKSLMELSLDDEGFSCSSSTSSVAYFCIYSAKTRNVKRKIEKKSFS